MLRKNLRDAHTATADGGLLCATTRHLPPAPRKPINPVFQYHWWGVSGGGRGERGGIIYSVFGPLAKYNEGCNGHR